jgi:hypothetical protein
MSRDYLETIMNRKIAPTSYGAIFSLGDFMEVDL